MLKEKWKEATPGSDSETPLVKKLQDGTNVRDALKIAQGQCRDTSVIIKLKRKELGATLRDPIGIKPNVGYRLDPQDEFWEKQVYIAGACIWVSRFARSAGTFGAKSGIVEEMGL